MKIEILDRVNYYVEKYTGDTISVAELLCDRHPEINLAFRIIEQDQSFNDISYKELREESEKLASGLIEEGVVPGDRIAMLMGKSKEFIVSLVAIWRVGGVYVPLFTAFSTPAVELRLKESNTKYIICDSLQLPKLEPIARDAKTNLKHIIVTASKKEIPDFCSAWDSYLSDIKQEKYPALNSQSPFIHIFTSGTTGHPKGVVLPIKALATLHAYAEFGLDLRSDDIFWNAADPGWAYGLFCGIIVSLATGIPSILLKGSFNPDLTLSILENHRITNFTAAPTVYRAIKSSTDILSKDFSIRCMSSAGEPLTPDVNQWALKFFGIPVHDHYGQTEASMIINNSHNSSLQRKLKVGSMGMAMPGWDVIVLNFNEDIPCEVGEVGRIAVDISSSPFAWFEGYIGNKEKSDEKFSKNGEFYLTGDTGKTDKDGYFYFISRDDDVIIMAGYRIGPFEVEAALSTNPAVNECAVIAAPDNIRGEVIEAFVVLKPNYLPSEELTKLLQEWVKTKFAAHAYPRSIHYVNSLPKNPSGKIQRYVLRDSRKHNHGSK